MRLQKCFGNHLTIVGFGPGGMVSKAVGTDQAPVWTPKTKKTTLWFQSYNEIPQVKYLTILG